MSNCRQSAFVQHRPQVDLLLDMHKAGCVHSACAPNNAPHNEMAAADELDKLRYDSAWAAELRRFAEAAHRCVRCSTPAAGVCLASCGIRP